MIDKTQIEMNYLLIAISCADLRFHTTFKETCFSQMKAKINIAMGTPGSLAIFNEISKLFKHNSHASPLT